MLKQILATTTVIAIAVVSIQSASAASKFRQLVVEPAGASADPIFKKKKKFQQLVVQSGSGIATPDADAAKTGGKQLQFVVAPGGGIPTPADTGNGRGKGNGKGKQVAEFVVAPGDGIPTPGSGGGAGNGNGNGKSGGKKFVPLILKPSNGITLASADPGKLPKTKVLPAIADLSGISKPVGDDSTGPGADATPALDPALEPQPTDATDPAVDGVDNGGAAAPEATPAIESPQDLYTVLLTHGYGVEILKHDAHGNLVFYVTAPGNPKEADLLLVDAEHGKVKERKHILAYGYERPQTYAPRYAAAYASDDNCDQSAGY